MALHVTSDLCGNCTKLRQQVEYQKTCVTEGDEEILILKQENTAIKEENNKLKSKYDSLNAENESLKIQNKTLISHNIDYMSQIDKFKFHIKEVTGKMADVQSELIDRDNTLSEIE